MRRACVLMRTSDYYRGDSFRAGLRRHGYEVGPDWNRRPGPDDVLLLWNRNRGYETIAEIYERAGGRVLVTENGYLGQPKKGGKFYALALSQHNGAGAWWVGESTRFPIEEKPWRTEGRHVVVLPQRGIGSRGVAMPGGWLKGIKERLARLTDRPIVIRPHPGPEKSDPWPDLRNAHCAVTWGSGAAIKALQYGIPVFHEFDRWIGAVASTRLDADLENCHTPDRAELWTRLTWAQWALSEIETGEAFDRLLHEKPDRLFRA